MEYLRLRSGGKIPIVGFGTFLVSVVRAKTALGTAVRAIVRKIENRKKEEKNVYLKSGARVYYVRKKNFRPSISIGRVGAQTLRV